MKLQITTSPETNTMRMVGVLDLYNVQAASEALLNQLSDKPCLELDLAGVETCDTAGMQLLLATRRSAEASGKTFSISSPAPVIEKCGQLLGLPPSSWQAHLT